MPASPPDAPHVLGLRSLSRQDEHLVGGKAANLGEMLDAGLPVPDGFVVTAAAFLAAMEAAGVRAELQETAAAVDVDDDAQLEAASDRMRALVRSAGVPDDLRVAVEEAYRRLTPAGEAPVAVRSSATGEDSAEASFAGANTSFTHVRGIDDLLARIVDCWASQYGARSVAYRRGRGAGREPAIAVVVQAMVTSARSGVIFTQDPTGAASGELVVEAARGLGEVVVGGQVEPDTYRVRRDDLSLVDVRVGHQAFAIVATGSGEERVALDPDEGGRRVLDDDEVRALAGLALRAERHYGAPQDLEFAIDADGRQFLVQSRPITTLGDDGRGEAPDTGGAGATPGDGLPAGEAVVHGLAASPGVAAGTVRIVADAADRGTVRPGDVLVAPMTSPDWVPALRRAAAVVTDGGGMTCHAAIVSRELGLPAIVGARTATNDLRDGEVVTVDGRRGLVFRGDRTGALDAAGPDATGAGTAGRPAAPEDQEPVTPLRTRILVNLAFPERAAAAAALPVDGVGLLRAEFILTEALGGVHPKKLLADGEARRFEDLLADALLQITRPFGDRPVVYRTTDFRTNEFRHLEGGEAYEPEEENPMIGYRGCYRYIRDPEVFRQELAVLARVREETPNLVVMIPFVRTPWELEACLELMAASPLGRQADLKRWIMAEVPSVVHHLPTYAALGIDGVSIGSNDLTQLMLGVDRDSETCRELFDESDPAVLAAIGDIIRTAREHGLTSSLCGQAPSNSPAYAAHLVRAGITSISVDPDAVPALRTSVAAAEAEVAR